jgi:RNA methyltransferase, TrmH family
MPVSDAPSVCDVPPVCADQHAALIERFRRARRDQSLAVLEGFHAIKHAIRFHAALEQVCAVNPDELRSLALRLAPDIGAELGRLIRPVPPAVFAGLAPVPPETGIIAIARRRQADATAILAARNMAPVVLLEAPAHLGNLGAGVRVAAAAGAAAVLTTGPQDPWHPAALRGAAGLHFALPVTRIDELPERHDRPLVAVHPDGEPLCPGILPARAILAFGSERRGLSSQMLAAADRQIAIPMRQGVSSLSLASAVAVILYTGRLSIDAGHTENPTSRPSQAAVADRSPLASGARHAISVLAKQAKAGGQLSGGNMRPSLDDLKRMAREVFGRELSEAQAEGYRGRLPTMARNVRLLRDWERRLGTLDPALVQRVGSGQ